MQGQWCGQLAALMLLSVVCLHFSPLQVSIVVGTVDVRNPETGKVCLENNEERSILGLEY